MTDIDKNKLYSGLLGYGMFSENLPPVFTSKPFYEYYLNLEDSLDEHSFAEEFFDYSLDLDNFKKHCKASKSNKGCQRVDYKRNKGELINFKNIRNINSPRILSIPNPFVYQKLCYCLRENWSKICNYFLEQTRGQSYKTSRIHIRRLFDEVTEKEKGSIFKIEDYKELDEVFEMDSNKRWRTDGNPETDLRIGKKYMVEADISNCFPSIYSHAIVWALTGKPKAKKDRTGSWENCLDCRTRNLIDGETKGLPIGPHASNLIAELILTKVDKALHDKGWLFVRYIDDYTCYVESQEKAESFLMDLEKELEVYRLALNSKKVKISDLPQTSQSEWTRELGNLGIFRMKKSIRILDAQLTADTMKLPLPQEHTEYFTYPSAKSYFDLAIKWMQMENDAAIFKYAIKTISGQELSDNAKVYIVSTMLHLAHIYPYLIRVLDEYVFERLIPKSIRAAKVENFTTGIFDKMLAANCYEGASYCLYFAIKYGFEIKPLNIKGDNGILKSGDCVLMLMGYLYSVKNNYGKDDFERKANSLLVEGLFESYWLFIYEVLAKDKLMKNKKWLDDPHLVNRNKWVGLKESGISFVKSEYRA